MRIVKVGVLAPTNKGIPLGVQGENRATEVEFDTRPWFREYPSGTVSAVARRNGDRAPYPLSLDVADGAAVWQVSDTDTAKAGEGAVELTMTSGGARVRSLTFKTLVTASLTDAPVDDDAWYGWLDKAVVKVDETVQSAQRKMDEVDAEWTGLKADVSEKVEECGKAAAQAADDAHHAKVDAQATEKALESAEGSVAKAEAAATRAEGAAEQAYGAAGQASVSAGNASDAASDAREASAHAAGWADMADKSARNAAESEENAARSASSSADSAERATAQKVAAENAKDAAESFKAGAEAAKGEAATSASNAESSATAAAQSASDAAASVGEMLSEAKKYTDANTSNALVGTVSGKLLHVEDAWPGKPLGLTIDGACKQDGTPSPENPVPIVVIENPVVKVTGVNMFDISKLEVNQNSPYGLNISAEDGYIIIQGTVSGTENNRPSFSIGWYADNSLSGKGFNINLFGAPSNVMAYGLRTADETQIAIVTSLRVGDKVDWKMQISVSKGEPKEYKPYTLQTLTFNLPSEHPYLAALPDGTHDEIVIDKDGNASLIARTYKTTLDRWFDTGDNYYAHTLDADWVINSATTTIGNASAVPISDAGKIWFGNTNFLIAYNPREDDTIDTINAIGIVAYLSQSPVTYSIGKLDIPSLPETISNVWTEAELTTNMSMTYKQDVNIIIADLTAQITAIKGTTDIVHDDSTASPDDVIDVPDNDVKFI